MPFLIISILILIHELGHFLTAKYYHFDIDKIYIYPYGGISKFNLKMNVSLQKELMVLLMGPVFQMITYYCLLKIPFFNSYHNLITSINASILVFNLLPIYPLDGGKLLNILLNYPFNFQKSLRIAIYISYITVICLFFYFLKTDFHFNVILMISFLLYKIREEWKNRKYYYDKFLLERYLNHYNYKKTKKITSIHDLYRDKNHIIKGKDRYYTEKEVLTKKFHF